MLKKFLFVQLRIAEALKMVEALNTLQRLLAVLLFTVLGICLGCSNQPAAIKPVEVDPYEASQQAIELYDTSDDGELSDEELSAVPAMARYKSLYDSDGNGMVSATEISKRLELWSDQGVGFRQLYVMVTLDGRPLSGAHVEFVPEPYLGEHVKPASGETGLDGMASIAVKREDMPPQIAKLPISGLTGGSYKIKVTHPSQKLPPRFNDHTELGEEVAFDTTRERSVVNLKSKQTSKQ